MYATLERVETLTPTIKTFWFRPEKPLDFVAGQFTELYLPHPDTDERGDKHWFTISSSPTEPLFSITTKFARGRSSTYKQTLLGIPVGTRLHFADPMGDFVLPKDKRIPLVFVAGGIGVTPVRSMVKYLTDRQERRDLTLIYDVHTAEDLVFADLFTAYGLRYTPLITTGPRDQSALGKVDTERILAAANTPDALIYLSGPEPLVETLNGELQKNGVEARRLITDFFHGYKSV
jgi:ferredoxin-NADP reductase